MPDRPILFSAPMVRALLAGTKTQTRRILKPQPMPHVDGFLNVGWETKTGRALWETRQNGGPTYGISLGDGLIDAHVTTIACDNRLWVKETWAKVGDADDDIHACPDMRIHAYYRCDQVDPERQKWRPSIFMPRWASRLTLIVTDVRIERLQDISEADAIAEGITQHPCEGPHRGPSATYWTSGLADCQRTTPQSAYAALWDSINGAGAWDENPWVVAVSFDVREGNIDA